MLKMKVAKNRMEKGKETDMSRIGHLAASFCQAIPSPSRVSRVVGVSYHNITRIRMMIAKHHEEETPGSRQCDCGQEAENRASTQ
jgi:hypothetical protein